MRTLTLDIMWYLWYDKVVLYNPIYSDRILFQSYTAFSRKGVYVMSLERIIQYAAQIQTIENRMNRDKYEEIAELDKQVEVYKSESNQVSASLTKINSDIRTVTQEIANSIHESYIDQAYSNVSSELKFWNIQKPVRKTTSTVQQLEDRLKKLLIEKKRLESVSLNQIEEKNIRSKTSIQKLHDNNRADLESKLRSLQKEVHTL